MSVSRRHLLGRACVVTAAAAAVAVPPACTLTTEDADLVRLGAEFDRAYSAWLPVRAESKRMYQLWRDTLTERGMSLREHGLDACEAVSCEIGADQARDANQVALDQLDRIGERIREIEPTSIAGLVAWAKATRFDVITPDALLKKTEDLDWDDQCLIAFLGQVERLARLETQRAAS